MKRADRKSKTIADLLGNAKRLFDENGYEATGLREITKAAGVSTGAFFANFKGKEEIYRELYGHAPIEQSVSRELMNIAERLIQWDIDFPVGSTVTAGLRELDQIIADGKIAVARIKPETLGDF